MIKKILTTLSIFVVACTADNNKEMRKPLYDEPALKEFVLSTRNSGDLTPTTLLDSLLQTASEDSAVFLQTVSYLEQPFGSPNSAYRNDSLYAVLLRSKAQSKWIDTVFKRKANERLHLLQQNRPGTIANDFTYQTPAGYQKKLHDLKAKFILLFFYNPECPACKEMKTSLTSSAIISEKIRSNELEVLAMYTDKDESIWLKHLDEMPKDWIQGRDQDEYLYNNNIYDLRAIPTIYLLDKEKKVVLKDCMDMFKIEQRLEYGS